MSFYHRASNGGPGHGRRAQHLPAQATSAIESRSLAKQGRGRGEGPTVPRVTEGAGSRQAEGNNGREESTWAKDSFFSSWRAAKAVARQPGAADRACGLR